MIARDRRLKGHLDALVANTDAAARRDNDPVGLVHRYTDPADREVIAVFAALIAFGRVAAFRPVVARIAAVADDHGGPRRWVTTPPSAWLPAIQPLVYRWNRGPDFALLAVALGDLLSRGGTLEDHLPREGTLPDALATFTRAVREAAARRASDVGVAASSVAELPRSFRTLAPDAGEGSACKRWWMLVRWLVRPEDGVDLGLWRSRSPSELQIPLDTHVGRISKLIGLTRRGDGSARTARDITAALARLDPTDPIRYDFALAHLGISGSCSSVTNPEVCPHCPLRPVCVVGGYGIQGGDAPGEEVGC